MNTDNFTPRKLPVGIQSFEKLRSEGFVYVDKTALIYKLTQAGVPCFLSRPRSFGSYWFGSGTPTFLVDMLKRTNFDLREIDGIQVGAASLSDDRADVNNPIPMVYQSGYLTIKKSDERFNMYTLGFPNEEVKYGFLNFATPFYTPISQNDTNFYIGKFIHELENGDTESFLTRLRAFFADFPYDLNRREGKQLSDSLLPRLQTDGAVHRKRSAQCLRACRCRGESRRVLRQGETEPGRVAESN